MLPIIIIVIAFAFFVQSILGFGSGLIAVPILSLFMSVQDAITLVMVFQLSVGVLVFNHRRDVDWPSIIKMLPSMVIGVAIGIVLIHVLPGDVLRGILAGYIFIHLTRKYSSFDPIKLIVSRGQAHMAGFLGGLINTVTGGGGPAFILYLQNQIDEVKIFRITIMAILVASNIPRLVGSVFTGLVSWDLAFLYLYGLIPFFIALYAGQKLYDKVPKHFYFASVDLLLTVTALLLVGKIVL